MTTIDELLQKHPVPWEMRVMTCGESAGDQWACDANGVKVFCVADVYSEEAQALLDAMAELVRLREVHAKQTPLFWEANAELISIRARIANLERINGVQFQALVDLAHGEEAQCLAAHLHEGTLECRADDPCAACIASRRIAEQDAELTELRACLSYSEGMYERRLEDIAALRAFRERMRDAPKRLADYAQAAIGCRHGDCIVADDIASGLRSGALDAVVFGEGG